jgi:hypothetical protein
MSGHCSICIIAGNEQSTIPRCLEAVAGLADEVIPNGNDLAAAGLLRQVPTDPYDGAPLRYRRLAAGAVIYSLGPDGRGDGGQLNGKSAAGHGTDLGFRLWDVGQRRQPHRPPR